MSFFAFFAASRESGIWLPMIRNLTTLLFISLMVAALAACGKKGPVRPKLLPLPAAPAGLAVEQRGNHFLLSWEIPERNQDGSPLTDLQGFRVERMIFQSGEDCPECREDFKLAAEIDLEYLRNAARQGNRLFWWDIEPAPGGTLVNFENIYVVPVPLLGKFAENVIVKLTDHEADTLMANLKVILESQAEKIEPSV